MVQHDRKHQMPDESGSFASVGARNAASTVVSNINQTLVVADNNAPVLSLPVGNISNDAAKNSNNVVVCHNCPPIPIFTPNDGLPILAPKPDALPPLAPILMRPLTTLADVVQASSMGQINFLAESLSHQIQLPNLTSIKLVSIAPKPATISIPTSTFGVIPQAPLTLLLQQKANTASPQMNWLAMRMKMHYGVHQNCGRPFCKLKKKDHYHCFDCNRAFSESTRLKSHIARHGITHEPNDNWMANRNGDTAATESSPGLSVSKEMEIKMEDASEELPNDEIKMEITDEPPAAVDETMVNEVQETPIDDSGSNSGINQPYSEVSQDLSDPLNPSTSGRTPSPAVALSNGYKKFRFDENCNQDRCAYCLSMTHYHCTRPGLRILLLRPHEVPPAQRTPPATRRHHGRRIPAVLREVGLPPCRLRIRQQGDPLPLPLLPVHVHRCQQGDRPPKTPFQDGAHRRAGLHEVHDQRRLRGRWLRPSQQTDALSLRLWTLSTDGHGSVANDVPQGETFWIAATAELHSTTIWLELDLVTITFISVEIRSRSYTSGLGLDYTLWNGSKRVTGTRTPEQLNIDTLCSDGSEILWNI